MSDKRNDDEAADQVDDKGRDDEGAEGEAPPPATWAGRRHQQGEDEVPAEGTGLTEEFDELERDVAGDLDTELAGEHEIPDASEEGDEADDDAQADEGPEPGDEFEFSEDDDEDADSESEAEEDAEEESGADEDGPEAAAVPAGAPTVEADTIAAADREEAREAAMEGLRNRTAEHAAKRGVTDPGHAPAPATPPKAAEQEADESKDAQEEDAEEPATAVAAAAASPPGTPEDGPAAEKPPRAGVWARFMAASFLIIASMATATAVSILVYLTDIAKGLGGLGDLSGQLDEIDEDAQNFLIIGSDVRPGQESHGLSDTTMLLRVDPDTNAITQLSIPRDLRVSIPGHGIDKFNAAYSYGGPRLTLKVVKQITGDIPINHVVNIDFHGFADAVDAIGCVYVDVDHHYFHSNEGLSSSSEEYYSEIDIDAGYQRLCGFKALQYVRFRHADNDIVRAARQQGFLREARQKVPPSKLLDDRNELIDIFKNYTTSDIDDTGTLVQLFKLMLDARDAQIAQIPFPVDSLDDEGYVTASDAPLKEAVSEFLGESGSPAAPPASDGGGGDEGPSKPGNKPDSKPEPDTPPPVDMIDATVSGSQYAAAILDAGGKELKFPVLYPTRLPPQSGIAEDTRFFGIDAGNHDLRHGYKFVMTYPGTTYNPAYYGVSGTDWLDAPLFENPSETRTIGDREYSFYYDAGKLRMLAFRRDNAWYWVTNTLDKLLTEPQMIAIAQNLREAGT